MRGRVVLFVSDKDTCNLPNGLDLYDGINIRERSPDCGSIGGFPFSNFQTLDFADHRPHPPHHASHHSMYL